MRSKSTPPQADKIPDWDARAKRRWSRLLERVVLETATAEERAEFERLQRSRRIFLV